MKFRFNNRIIITIAAFLIAGIFILIEHYTGGVETHYFLAREDLPGISNWWGLLTLPLLAWFVSTLINKRNNREDKSKQVSKDNRNILLKRFFSSLLFGIAVSILWAFNLDNILQYFILIPILIAFFIPLHLAEYLLGFVFGMIYIFGGVLPIIIGLILLILCFFINKLMGLLKNLMKSKSNISS